MASIVNDAGDDPDVTHGATITTTVRLLPKHAGIVFKAGDGVGTVTKPGLPLAVGEPAINPAPRAMIKDNLVRLAQSLGVPHHLDLEIEISVANGAEIAKRTWNTRLGIVGGLSILGTTGIVRPFSCSAWIASIHRGIDVARATGVTHALAATGSTSEAAARQLYDFPAVAQLDMGDFFGGMLKYLRNHPLPQLTIAGGFAKLTKLAQGALDLHSDRSQVDFRRLAGWCDGLVDDIEKIRSAQTALAALALAGPRLAQIIADKARDKACSQLHGAPIDIEVIVVSRTGDVIGRAGFQQ
jgi:cobalt-precorrin-5B (C1)-methyltransferase